MAAAVLSVGALFFGGHFGWSQPSPTPVQQTPSVIISSQHSGSNTSNNTKQPPKHSSGGTSGSTTSTSTATTTKPTPPPPPPPQNPPPSTSPTSTPPATSSGEIYLTAYTTSYAAGDNDPAGSIITYISGIEGSAGGTGTYQAPITLAVGYVGEKPDIPAGTKFYIPNVRRYFIVADTCAECHQTPKGVQVWVDMYAGDYSGKGVLACEDTITGNYTIIENPSPTYAVVPGSLFNGTSCTAQYGNTPTH